MATAVVCDHDGLPAAFRIRVDAVIGGTVTEFDCCSASCAAECLESRLALAEEPVPEPVEESTEPNPED